MNVFDLRLFVAVADASTFARAAKSFGLSTSTLSRRVARLEDELGVTMFERRSCGVRLTSSGRAVLLRVKRVLAHIDAITGMGSDLGTGKRGSIDLGVQMPPVGEPICNLLAEWHLQYPDVRVRLSEMPDRELQIAVEDRRLDVVLVANYGLWPGAESTPICRERLWVALPSDHQLAKQEQISWNALKDEAVLVQDWSGSHFTRDYYASLFNGAAELLCHAAGKQSLLALVSAGFGVTLVTESQSIAAFPGVAFRLMAEPNAWVEINLAWNPEIEEATVGRFVAFMRNESRLRRLS